VGAYLQVLDATASRAVTIPYRSPASIDGARDAADLPKEGLTTRIPGAERRGLVQVQAAHLHASKTPKNQ
jgi:hypothetical protein